MTISVHFDNVIYTLQKKGGASLYWQELTSRVAKNTSFKVVITKGQKINRFLPVFSTSDIFHSSHFRTVLSKKTKLVSTIHDLNYEIGLTKSSKLGTISNIWQRQNAIEKSDAIICVSHSTKKDMLKFYPQAKHKPISVIYLGVSFDSESKLNINVSERLQNISLCLSKFALYVGVRKGYKNFNSALLGFAKSQIAKEGYYLICTGSKFNSEEEQLINKLNLKDKILVLDYATQSELVYLYQNAFALIYTSTYEGFGLPPLEAMSCGCPVIASNTSSIPEVVGDAGILLDNTQDYASVAKSLDSLLNDSSRNEYVCKGLRKAKHFTWEEAARKHMKVYESILD